MKLIWKVVKGVIFATGVYVWGSAIKDAVDEYNEHKDDPLVMPVMLMK